MLKASKRIVISTSALNSKGFRLLTSGADLSEYKENPIMLWMHLRAWAGKTDEVLPLGYIDEIKIEGDKITGLPCFDDTDDFAERIYNKLENGTIRMASAGANPVAASEDPKLMLPGQTLPTVTKWKLKEVSLVDIGSNPEALAATLYDDEGAEIKLSADGGELLKLSSKAHPSQKIVTDMNTIELSLSDLAILKLSENAGKDQVLSAIKALSESNTTLKDELTKKETELVEVNKKLSDSETAAAADKIERLVQKAVDERKITADQKPAYVELAAANYESVEKLLSTMTGSPTVQHALAGGTTNTDRVAELIKLSARELFLNGGMQELKELDEQAYKVKKEELSKSK